MHKYKVKKNLKLSTIEGCFWAVMYGGGETFLSACAVFLQFSPFQISFLSSFPPFIGSCFQLFSSIIKNKFKDIKQFVVTMSYLQAILWIVLVILLFYKPTYKYILIWSCIYWTIGTIIQPVWTAWMGYFVPRRIRARYFGKRNRIIGFISFLATLIAGYILDIFSENLIFGFAIIFIAAFIGRALSAFYLNKKFNFEEKETQNIIEYISSFKNLIKNKNKSFYYIVFNSYISFSIMFFGPLFSIYMLRTMELGVLVYTINMTLWQISNFSCSSYFGKLCEKIGDYKVLKISTYMIVFLPILWILLYYLDNQTQILATFLVSILAGVCFSAFTLSSFNLLYKISKKEDVIHFSALGTFIKGAAILMGGILAGLIVESSFIKQIAQNFNLIPIHISMLVSVLLRFLSIPILNKINT
ncbi:MAG: MFS transporter [Candidatus Neomarinimicrobiota bacterium]